MPQPPPPATLVMFAGMGAGLRFVAPQKRAFRDAMWTPAWPMPRRRETVAAYAERWAAELATQLPTDRPLVVAGVSFGGMIALEMATRFHAHPRLRPRKVLLIASARSGGTVAPLWRILERIASPVPWRLASPIAPLLGYLHGVQMGLGPAHRRLVSRVARHLDLTLTQWCARGVTHWPGLPPDRLAHLPPVRQIHGAADPMMPLDRVGADTVIPGGRHLIHLSHADAVNAWIRDHLLAASQPDAATTAERPDA